VSVNSFLCQKSQKDSFNKVTIFSETRSTWGSAPRCAFTPLYLHLTMNRGSGRVTPSIWFGARLAPQPILLIFLLYNKIKVEIISNIRYSETLHDMYLSFLLLNVCANPNKIQDRILYYRGSRSTAKLKDYLRDMVRKSKKSIDKLFNLW